jgi:ParB-like nuclease domain
MTTCIKYKNINFKVHPAANLFPDMKEAELKELAADIKANGLAFPIVIDETSAILDGRNRLRACEIAGVEPRFEKEKDADPVAFVISANIRRRHLKTAQKRELIAKLIKLNPEKSDRQIAETVKASPSTVGKARKATVQTGQLKAKRIGKDGKARKQPARKSKPVNPPAVPKQNPSETALAELKFAINRYVPKLDADDLKTARSIFEATASANPPRVSGSAEIPEDVRRAEMEMLGEQS